MSKSALTGTRIRARRNLRGLRQLDLARMVGVSPSYMNLIEHNRRKVSPELLVALAKALGVSEDALAEDTDSRLLEGVRAAAMRAGAEMAELARIEEFTGRFPGWANVLAETQARVERLERVVEQLSDRMSHDPYLGEALHEIISAVTSVQSTAAILNDADDISPDWQARFHHNILQDSSRLAEGAVALVNYIDAANDTETGLASPLEEVEAWLTRRGYYLPELDAPENVDLQGLVTGQAELSSSASRSLALQWLGRLRDDARALPLASFLAAVKETGCAPDQLAAQFDAPIDRVLRRLAMLPQAKMHDLGAPRMGLVICDGSGTLIFRRPVDGFPLPRFGGGCPLWPLYHALRMPGQALRVPLVTDGRLGQHFLSYAVCQPVSAPDFNAPPVLLATMLLVATGRDDGSLFDTARRVGGSCRTCAQIDCTSRREPSILIMSAEAGDASREPAVLQG
ncbi:MAG: helix-turn-helix domain-containing protein [Rhodobacteraceae bacterium]|nr:helix-turn-helix domain-containing protein [Paracoccaceae bacterium]